MCNALDYYSAVIVGYELQEWSSATRCHVSIQFMVVTCIVNHSQAIEATIFCLCKSSAILVEPYQRVTGARPFNMAWQGKPSVSIKFSRHPKWYFLVHAVL